MNKLTEQDIWAMADHISKGLEDKNLAVTDYRFVRPKEIPREIIAYWVAEELKAYFNVNQEGQ
jgi:hypothetical protein